MGKHTMEGMPKWARDLCYAAKLRATRKEIAFTLSANDVAELIARCDGRCEISGIPFEFDRQGHRVKRPFAPSLDRIDHKGGYVPGNVRFVCVAANVAMNVWGEGALRRLAEGICGHSDVAGVYAPAPKGAGTAVRRLKNGRCSYQARIRFNGEWRYFGSFKTRAEAAARSSQAREEFALRLHRDFSATA